MGAEISTGRFKRAHKLGESHPVVIDQLRDHAQADLRQQEFVHVAELIPSEQFAEAKSTVAE